MNSPFSIGMPELILISLILGVIIVMASLVVGLIVSLVRSAPKPPNLATSPLAEDSGRTP